MAIMTPHRSICPHSTIIYPCVSSGSLLGAKYGLSGPRMIMFSSADKSQFHYTSSILWSFWRPCCVPFRLHTPPTINWIYHMVPGKNSAVHSDHITMLKPKQIAPWHHSHLSSIFHHSCWKSKWKSAIPPKSRRLHPPMYNETAIFDGHGSKKGRMGLAVLPNLVRRGCCCT